MFTIVFTFQQDAVDQATREQNQQQKDEQGSLLIDHCIISKK